MNCKICKERIFWKNGRWQHKYDYPHDAIPENNEADPFKHTKYI